MSFLDTLKSILTKTPVKPKSIFSNNKNGQLAKKQQEDAQLQQRIADARARMQSSPSAQSGFTSGVDATANKRVMPPTSLLQKYAQLMQQKKQSELTKTVLSKAKSIAKQAPINAISPLAQFIPSKVKEGITSGVGNFAGGVAQSVPREMMSLALQERIAKQKVADTIKKKTGVSVPFLNQKSAPETQFTPKTGFEKFVLGNEKVVPAQQYGEEQIKSLPFGIGKKVSNKTASRFAVPLVIGSVASNFFGGKAEVKGIEEALTAAKDVGTATKILKKAGVADDLIKEYAPILAKTSKAEEVSKIVSHLDDLSKTTQEAAKPIIGGIKKAIAPSKDINPLMQEARKYKSAEEFVKAHEQNGLMDLSNYEKHRFGRALDEFTGRESIKNFLNGKSELGSMDTLKYENPAVYKAISSPGDTVTVYQAVPKNASDALQIGDYVTLEKRYAQMHLNSVLEGEQKTAGKIIEMKVPKSDVIWHGNDYNEWIYSPQKIRDQYPNGLIDIYNQATKGINPAQKASGALAGVEIKKDENGKTKISFNTNKALLGLAATTVGPKAVEALKASKVAPEVNTYLKELEQQQKIARGTKAGNAISKAAEFYKEAKVKLVDSLSPIEDTLRAAEKEGGYKLLTKHNISESGQLDKVLRISSQVEQFARKNGLNDIIREAPDLSHLDQYVLAKRHVLDLADKGIETGRDLEKDKRLIEALAPQYENLSKKVVAYSHKLLDTAVDGGLISKELAAKLKIEHPNYVPMQRIFSEIEQEGMAHGGTKAIASLGKQSLVKRMLGSKRAIESPVHSLMEKTNDLVKQVEINKAAQMLASYEKLPGNPFGIVPLRTAENVEKRIKTLQELGDIFAEKRKLERGLKTANKSVQKLTKKIGTHENEIESLIEEARVKASEFESPSQINNLLDKTLTRERKIHSLEADLLVGKDVKKQQELQGLIQERKGSISELRHALSAARDIPKNVADQTISVFKNGIKEVYKVNPDIAQAAKNLNQTQIGLLGQIFAVPTRIAKAGITGFNTSFIAANLLKDQLFSMVTSGVTRKTSAIANPANFMKSLFETVKHGDLYDEVVKSGAMSTSFDISRNQLPQTVARIRAGKSLKTKALYTVTHPSELFRAVENVIGKSEELTRIQQFRGTKQALLKQGRTAEDATMLAGKAARENTANFARFGEWGKALNGALLYLNASKEGSRSLIRAFKANPVATSAKIATTVLLPSAIITAYNLKDPERKKIYEDIPEYEKESNLIIIPQNAKKDENGNYGVIKIPLPPGLSNFTSLVRRPLEAANGLDHVKFMDIANPLLGFSPINLTRDGKISPSSIASSVVPQAIKPTIEGMTNTDLFTGAPQVSQKYSRLSPGLQAKPNTSGLARILAGKFGISPIKTEAFIKGTFGETGMNILNAADKTAARVGVIPKDQIGGRSFLQSLQRRFSEARGGEMENKQWNEENKMTQKDIDERFLLKQEENAQRKAQGLPTLEEEAATPATDKSKTIFEKIKKLPDKELSKVLTLLKKQDYDTYSDVNSLLNEQRNSALSAKEKYINSKKVGNGDRATYIYGEMKKLGTKQEKGKYIADLQAKKIITVDVEKQLVALIKAGGF